jgi:hypothetical protein
MTGIGVQLRRGSAVGTRTLFDAIDRADTLRPISVAVFADAAAWAADREYMPWRPPDQAGDVTALSDPIRF